MADDDKQLLDPTGATRTMLFEAALGRLYQRAEGADVLGTSRDLTLDIYRQSLVGDIQPGTWLEIPLLGKPGYDMNVFYRREQVHGGERFVHSDSFGFQPIMDWLASTPHASFGIGFAYDLIGGEVRHGVYVNPNNIDVTTRDGFYAALGERETGAKVARVTARQPKGWCDMEEAVFLGREGKPTRVASRVDKYLQREYAKDASLLASHLQQVGYTAIDDDKLACLCEMAAAPFEMWLEYDVLDDGSVGEALGADHLFGGSVLSVARTDFTEGGPAACAMHALERHGLADERWRHLADATMATLMPLPVDGAGPSFLLVRSEPDYVKAKWAPGKPPLAKVYQGLEAKLLGTSSASR